MGSDIGQERFRLARHLRARIPPRRYILHLFYTVSQLHSSDGYKTRTQPRDVTGVCSFGQKRRHTHPYCHRGRGSRYRQQREMGISCSCLPRVSEGYDYNNVSEITIDLPPINLGGGKVRARFPTAPTWVICSSPNGIRVRKHRPSTFTMLRHAMNRMRHLLQWQRLLSVVCCQTARLPNCSWKPLEILQRSWKPR